MLKPHVYKGIEFISLDELAEDLKEEILEIVSEDLVIKILVDDRVVSNCILFPDYQKCMEALTKRRSLKGSAA